MAADHDVPVRLDDGCIGAVQGNARVDAEATVAEACVKHSVRRKPYQNKTSGAVVELSLSGKDDRSVGLKRHSLREIMSEAVYRNISDSVRPEAGVPVAVRKQLGGSEFEEAAHRGGPADHDSSVRPERHGHRPVVAAREVDQDRPGAAEAGIDAAVGEIANEEA